MGRDQYWRTLGFGQEYRKGTPGHVPRVTTAVSPCSSMARGLERYMCVALAPPPRCIPCSLEVDRREVSAQGKVAGWWAGGPGIGLVAKPHVLLSLS